MAKRRRGQPKGPNIEPTLRAVFLYSIAEYYKAKEGLSRAKAFKKYFEEHVEADSNYVSWRGENAYKAELTLLNDILKTYMSPESNNGLLNIHRNLVEYQLMRAKSGDEKLLKDLENALQNNKPLIKTLIQGIQENIPEKEPVSMWEKTSSIALQMILQADKKGKT